MPTAAPSPAVCPPVLVSGDDEFAVKERARRLYHQWCADFGGLDNEIIDATAANAGEALRALARLREALQTLPLFGAGKVVWFQNCNFLGEERAAATQAVGESLNDLARELKATRWDRLRLLISAGKVDKRKTFAKAFEKLGTLEVLAGLSGEDKDWAGRAEAFVIDRLQPHGKEIAPGALRELVAGVGPQLAQLANEVEKLALYVGDRCRIVAEDVAAVAVRYKQARAFALGDALGDRHLARALRALDEELWAAKQERDRSAIGLLYGLIAKVRVLLFLKEARRLGWLKPTADYGRFRAQLERVPTDALPQDKRFNPLAQNPYVLFKALPQTEQYSAEELVAAMQTLLTCNQRLVASKLDEALVLQQGLVQIIGHPTAPRPAA